MGEVIQISTLPFEEAVALVMKIMGMDIAEAEQLVAIEQGLMDGDLTEQENA